MTIDANIVIAYIAGDEPIVATLSHARQEGQPLFLSTIAEAEVLGFPGFTLGERERTARFLAAHFISIPCDRAVAYQAAQLRATLPVKLPDAIIAATALLTGTPLATRNSRDFKNVPGLVISLREESK